MAYFPNGDSGLFYKENFCFKCINWIDKNDGRDFGCPIWDLHLSYSYELCNSKSIAKKMLDLLIPMKECEYCECSMFQKKKCVQAQQPVTDVNEVGGKNEIKKGN